MTDPNSNPFSDRTFTRFQDIPLFKYDLIMADPPWPFETYSDQGKGKSAENHYSTMTDQDIWDLPVANWLGPNSIVWLWATWPKLDAARACAEAWGITYATGGCWAKLSKNSTFPSDKAKQAFGTGYVMRGSSEPFLILTCGNPVTSKDVRNSIIAPVGEHSEKPQEAFLAAERLMPGATRLELFSRRSRPGWDVFGDQVGVLTPDYAAKGIERPASVDAGQPGFEF